MLEENTPVIIDSISTNSEENSTASTALTTLDQDTLQAEALQILNELISETDVNKVKDLTFLFNQNQNKKTMIRVSKQSELLDALTDQTIKRVREKPDQLSNDDLNKLMKTVSDLIEKGQNQINRTEDAPLIQINQQNNEVSMNDGQGGLNRESRDRVKNAVINLLKQMSTGGSNDTSVIDSVLSKPDEEEDY